MQTARDSASRHANELVKLRLAEKIRPVAGRPGAGQRIYKAAPGKAPSVAGANERSQARQ